MSESFISSQKKIPSWTISTPNKVLQKIMIHSGKCIYVMYLLNSFEAFRLPRWRIQLSINFRSKLKIGNVENVFIGNSSMTEVSII